LEGDSDAVDEWGWEEQNPATREDKVHNYDEIGNDLCRLVTSSLQKGMYYMYGGACTGACIYLADVHIHACIKESKSYIHILNSCVAQRGQHGNAWLPCSPLWTMQLICPPKCSGALMLFMVGSGQE
jgi:hypothetical protein